VKIPHSIHKLKDNIRRKTTNISSTDLCCVPRNILKNALPAGKLWVGFLTLLYETRQVKLHEQNEL